MGSHPDLVNFHAGGNSINTLDVTNAPSLRSFLVWGSSLSEIDFTNNPLLEEVDLNVNNLFSLNLSNNPNLNFVFCNSNNLSSLNIANGNNAGMILPEWSEFTLDARGNENLRCIQVDQDMENITRTDWIANPGIVFSTDCTNLPTVYVPDANFEQVLIDQGVDSDGIINQSILEVDAAVTSWLDLSNAGNGYGIKDLTGIEAFINLVDINCNKNQINNLDFSYNPKLKYIYANECEVQNINVSNNPDLVNLHLYNNNISELDLSNNIQLKELIVQTNNITNLDLSANSNLTMAYCADNRLNSLNIANGNNVNFAPPEWSTVAFSANGNSDLYCIQADEAILANIPSDWGKDVHAVYSADCSTYVPENVWGIVGTATPNDWAGPDIPMEYDAETNSWSTTTDLTDGLIKFRLNNDWTYNLGDGEWENPIRDGIAEQDGADIPVTAGYYNISIDFDTYEYIITPAVYIPDANFEQALIDLGIDSDGVINQKILRSDAESVTELNVTNPKFASDQGFANSSIVNVKEKIQDLTGIEAFVNITKLTARANSLSSVDFSQNILLERVDLIDNLITSIDISQNTGLNVLWLEYNQLVNIDLSENTELFNLALGYNQLSEIDVTKNPKLWVLRLQNNKLSQVDLTQNTVLRNFQIGDNPNLTNVDFSNKPELYGIGIYNTSISSLDLSNNPITFLHIANNPDLEHLDLRNGNNLNLNQFLAYNTPILNCINADAEFSQAMMDSGKSFSTDCGDFVFIPDPNFEQALIDIGVDSDGVVNEKILRSDAESVTELNVTNPKFVSDQRYANSNIVNVEEKIQDLTGIEAFVNITKLSAWANALTSVDVSRNTLLETLELVNNQINSIDVSQNTKLKIFWLESNNLDEVDLTNNPELENIALGYNNLTEIDVTQNTKLWALTIEGNNLTTIDVSQNTVIAQIWLAENPNLTQVDFSKNTEMYGLAIYNTAIKTLDLSNNPISRLYIANNPRLEHLDIRNGLNKDLDQFWVENTPKLTCINADAEISETMINSGKNFSQDCGDFIYIPDPNFEQALIDLEVDGDGVVNTSVLREDVENITSLNMNFPELPNGEINSFADSRLSITEKIEDLTGIEAFVNLHNLQVGYGLLTDVDLSANTQLEELFLNDNQLNSIDVSMLPNLKRFGIMRNNMTSGIDVSGNPLLEELFVHNTGINSIDLSANPNLWNLFIQNNELTSLELSANTALKRLSAQHNQLSGLDISTLSVIERIDAQYNPNMTLVTGAVGNPTLTSLNLSGTGISNFNGAAYPNLEWLLLNDNSLGNFNGNNNLNLQNLFLNNNAITKLGLTGNSQLVQLQVMNNGMEELDLRNGNNSILEKVIATGNLLTCISVDNPEDSTMPYSLWELDLGVQLSLNCKQAEEVVIIPDANFEQALIDRGFDTNGFTGNILLSEAEAVTTLDISNEGILDASGIEGFVNLTDLNISDNLLTEINLIENSDLVSLDVSGNGLTELYISSGRYLIILNAENNNLQQLNISDLTGLENLDISGNSFDSVILNDLSGLVSVDVSNNELSKLDLRNGNNSLMEVMNAANNPSLECIGVDDETNIPEGWDKDIDANYTNSGDCVAPVVLTQNITVYLDRYGSAEISPEDIDAGSYDNVTEQKNLMFELSTTQFSCDNLGDNEVYLFVTDESDNVRENNEPAIVTVVDEIAPDVSAVRSVTLDLKGSSSAPLELVNLDAGSTDNCVITDFSVNQSSFSFPGEYTVEYTVADASGNSSSTMVDVEVVDSQSNPTFLKFKGNIVAIVYPNPFTEYFKIGFSEPVDMSTVSAMVFDMGGGDTGLQFYVSGNELISDGNLSQQGTYILHVSIDGQTRSAEIRQD